MLCVRPAEGSPIGTYDDFLLESEDLGGAATLASASCLLVGGVPKRRRVWADRMTSSNAACMWCRPCSCPAIHVPATFFLQT